MMVAQPQPDSSALVAPAQAGSAAAQQGELVITELMIDPKALRDSEGEWIELYNASARELSLRGCEIGDGGDDLHAITKDIRLPPGGYATLARSTAAGFMPDALVPISLTNRADSVSVRCDGREIDVVHYDKAKGFPVSAGKSTALNGSSLSASANDAASAWCVSQDSYGVELGTPGQPNPACDAAAEATDSDTMMAEHARTNGQAATDSIPKGRANAARAEPTEGDGQI